MDISRSVEAAAASVECPHCGHVEADDYDVLDTDCVYQLRCVECARQFHLAILECPGCEGEGLFAWAQPPLPERMARLACVHCGQRYKDHEADTGWTDRLA
jgi:transcription elongation factor Elf1